MCLLMRILCAYASCACLLCAQVVWSLSLMIIGAVAAGYNDLEFNTVGYVWVCAHTPIVPLV